MTAMTPRRRSAVAWSIVALCAVPALLSALPPFSMLLVELAVLTKEASPLFLAATLIAIPLAVSVAPPGKSQRMALWFALELVALVEIWPLASAHTGAAFSYSLREAVLGDSSHAPITERRVKYTAADGSPLELLLLRGPDAGPRPTIVSIYGGAWRAGSPDQAISVNRHFARRGYTVVAIDYRHAPASRSPAQIEDVWRSLALIADSAASWGVDTARVVFVGRSAGGHLALLAAWEPPPSGRVPITARAVVGFYAPYDLAKSYDDRPSPDPIDVRQVLRMFIGGPPAQFAAQYQEASPSSYVRPGLPPTLLVYAGRDHLVQSKFGRAMAADLHAAGDSVSYVELPWAEHGFDLLPHGIGEQASIAAMETFLKDFR
jgi:acetyl esterase/lipase